MASRWFDRMREEREKEAGQNAAPAENTVEDGQIETPAAGVSVTRETTRQAWPQETGGRDEAAQQDSAFETHQAEVIRPDTEFYPTAGVDSKGKNVYDLSHLSHGGLNDARPVSYTHLRR